MLELQPLRRTCGQRRQPSPGDEEGTPTHRSPPRCSGSAASAASPAKRRSRSAASRPTATPPSASGVVEFIGRRAPAGSCAIGMSHILSLSDGKLQQLLGLDEVDGSGRRGRKPRARGFALDAVAPERSRRIRPSTPVEVSAATTPGPSSPTTTTSSTSAWTGLQERRPAASRRPRRHRGSRYSLRERQAQGQPSAPAGTARPIRFRRGVLGRGLQLPVHRIGGHRTWLSLGGQIVNQPPTSDSEADRPAVEASIAGGARGHARRIGELRRRWQHRTGAMVPREPLRPRGRLRRSVVEQALNTQVSYVLRVIDGFGQADEDTTVAKVVDTTAPVISCNVPATIRPPTALVPSRTAVDICDPQVGGNASNPSCFFFNRAGEEGQPDEHGGCIVTLRGRHDHDLRFGWRGRLHHVGRPGGRRLRNTSIVTCRVHLSKPW